jgi:hypothetical protein
MLTNSVKLLNEYVHVWSNINQVSICMNVAESGTVWQLSVNVFHAEFKEYLCDRFDSDSGSEFFDEDSSLLDYIFLFIHCVSISFPALDLEFAQLIKL